MIALVKQERSRGATIKDVPEPQLLPGHVLARVKVASICGTDAHIYEWNNWASSRVEPPRVMGHEFAAVVEEIGEGVESVRKGDLISGETHIYCGHCHQCRIGNFHLCENMRLRGVDTDGSFAELVLISEKTIWKNHPSLSADVASVQEPLGNAVHSVFSGEISGRSVVVFGCGPIGLCSIALCKAAGSDRVIAVDLSDYRLELAHKMGADVLINASREDPKSRISVELPQGADVVLEMSGSERAIRDALKVARPAARISLLGLPEREVTINLSDDVIFKGLTIQGIFGRKIFATWELASTLLLRGAVDLRRIITHKLKFQDYSYAFDLIRDGKCGKIVMEI